MSEVEGKEKGSDDLWQQLVELVNTPVAPRAGKKNPCPPVAAIIAGNGLTDPICECHGHVADQLICRYGEQQAIDRLLDMSNEQRIDFKHLQFYTSLEPCNQRDQSRVPCAHRIATLGFGKVFIGMMDPDPNIFAHGVSYLITNLGRDSVSYAPRNWRERMANVEANAKFIKSKVEKFDFSAFTEKNFPIFTGLDEERYLRMAHALFRMFPGKRIVWLFPRLPTFCDTHKFHAVWVEGMLSKASNLEQITIVMHEDEWIHDINDACAAGMKEILLDEFKDINKPKVELVLMNGECDSECPCTRYDFKGAILYDQDKRISFLVVPSYSTVCGIRVPVFLACTPRYITTLQALAKEDGGGKEVTQRDVEQLTSNLSKAHSEAIAAGKSEHFSEALYRQIGKWEQRERQGGS